MRKAHFAGEHCNLLFMRVVAISMHQHDGDGAQPVILRTHKFGTHFVEIQRSFDSAVGAHALVNLGDTLVEHVGLDDVLGKNLRPRLVADAQRIAEAPGDEEKRALALALKQRIGGDRGAHLHRADLRRRYGLLRRKPEQMANARHSGIPIRLGIFRQELVGDELAVGPPADHVGEGAAAVDPEFPASGHKQIYPNRSFPRMRESSKEQKKTWVPAYVETSAVV